MLLFSKGTKLVRDEGMMERATAELKLLVQTADLTLNLL